MQEDVDVLICGSGSAGICAGLWLARCGISYKILERRGGPLDIGQADGVQCRTVEIFESFGISDALLREAYHVLELAYWSSGSDSEDGGIKRSHFAPDAEPGLSHLPHVILNQGRVHRIMLEEMTRLTSLNDAGVLYGYDVQDIQVDPDLAPAHDQHAVRVTAVKDGVEHTFRAKYLLVSCFINLKVMRGESHRSLRDRMGRTAQFAELLGSKWLATAAIKYGGSWTFTLVPTFLIFAGSQLSSQLQGAFFSYPVKVMRWCVSTWNCRPSMLQRFHYRTFEREPSSSFDHTKWNLLM